MSTIGKGCFAELQNLEEFTSVLKSANPVLVDFSAVWCGPCRLLGSVLTEISKSNPNTHFVKVDVDKLPTLATKFSISSVPHVILFKNGKPVDSFLGARNSAAVQEFLDKNK